MQYETAKKSLFVIFERQTEKQMHMKDCEIATRHYYGRTPLFLAVLAHMKLELFSFLCILLPSTYFGFASWMENEFCEREWKLGDVVMNANIVSSKERRIRVFRENAELFSNDSYIPNEMLMVTLSDKTGDYLFQTNAGKFDPGGCHGLRSSRKSTALAMPVNSQIVEIQAGTCPL